MDEPPFKGFVPTGEPVTLDGRVPVLRSVDAGNRGRDMMRNNKHHSHQKANTGNNTRAAPPVYTAEQRKTVRDGLRVLAKIIAHAHLRRQAVRCGAIPEATNGERPREGPTARCRKGRPASEQPWNERSSPAGLSRTFP